MKRAIHIIPDLSQAPQIAAFRRLHDPLYRHIEAHITLVFPFDLPVSDDAIISHCQSCADGIEPFAVQLQTPHRSHDDHLWLPVVDSTPLQLLTDRLYSGPLSVLAETRRHSAHHITVARPPLPPQAECDWFHGQLNFPVTVEVNHITLEEIQPDESSLVLGSFKLRSSSPHE